MSCSSDPQEERMKSVATRSHQKEGRTTLDAERAEGEDEVSAEAPTAATQSTNDRGNAASQIRWPTAAR
jgi:hypothetical protein